MSNKKNTPDRDFLSELSGVRKAKPASEKEKKSGGKKPSGGFSIKKFFSRLLHDKRFRHGSASILLTVLFVCALVLANFVASLAVQRLPALSPDLSKQGVYSLSEQTIELLDSLDEDIQIWIFASESACEQTTADLDPYGQVPLAHELIKRYAQYSSHIEIIYVDLATQPGYLDVFSEFRDYLSAYSVAVTSARRTRVTSFYEFLPSLSGTASTDDVSIDVTSSMTEMYISSLIKTVTLDVTPKVVYLDGASTGSDAVNLLDALNLNGYEVVSVDFRTAAIPQDADMLVLSSPSTDLTYEQCDKLEGFLSNSGAMGKTLLVFTSAFMPDTPNLNALLSDWGISMSRSVVYEGESAYVIAGSSPAAFRPCYAEHDYTAELIDRNVACMVENALDMQIPTQVMGSIVVNPILASSSLGYLGDLYSEPVGGEYAHRTIMLQSTMYSENANGDQIRSDIIVAPLSLCYYDYFGNTSTYANYSLLMTTCNQRCGILDENLDIPSKLLTDVDFSVSDSTVAAVTVIFGYIVPLLTLAAGAVVFIRRRRL